MQRQQRHAGAFRVDGLGRLCLDGQEVAAYLFQAPTDDIQWRRLREIVNGIIRSSGQTGMRELPAVAHEMRDILSGPPSVLAAERLNAGFDRIVQLLKAARSGLFVAIP
jgi:hypothetical protein